MRAIYRRRSTGGDLQAIYRRVAIAAERSPRAGEDAARGRPRRLGGESGAGFETTIAVFLSAGGGFGAALFDVAFGVGGSNRSGRIR